MIRKPLALILSCALLTGTVLSGCGAEETEVSTTTVTTEATQPTTAAPEEQSSEATQPEMPLDEVCTVETPYGELHFQAQYSPYMKIRQEQEGDVLKVFFLAELNGKEYPLFDLTISDKTGEDDQLLLTDDMGVQRSVDVYMADNLEHEELDSSGQQILYSMQEQINFILQNMK